MLTPGVQGVVEHQAIPKLLMVILEHVRKAQRNRQQAGALRREISPAGDSPPYDEGELIKCRIVQLVLFQERIAEAVVRYNQSQVRLLAALGLIGYSEAGLGPVAVGGRHAGNVGHVGGRGPYFWASTSAAMTRGFRVRALRMVRSIFALENPAARNSLRKGPPSFAPAIHLNQFVVQSR